MSTRLRFASALALGTVIFAAPIRAEVTHELTTPDADTPVTSIGYHMSPYSGPIAGQQTMLNSVDFFHGVAVNDVWQPNERSAARDSLDQTRFGGLANTLALFQQAAGTGRVGNAGGGAIHTLETAAVQPPSPMLSTNSASPGRQDARDATGRQTFSWWIAEAQTKYASGSAGYGRFYATAGAQAAGTHAAGIHAADTHAAPVDANDEASDLETNTVLAAPTQQALAVQVTPEPGTLVLVATGFMGLVGVVRRRKRSDAPLAS